MFNLIKKQYKVRHIHIFIGLIDFKQDNIINNTKILYNMIQDLVYKKNSRFGF